MTNKEAIEIITLAIDELGNDYPIYDEAFGVAISALQKQIPKESEEMPETGWATKVCPKGEEITNEKAIEQLEIFSQDYILPIDNAFDKAIEALEKQIPKKLIKNENHLACPNCGAGEQFIMYKKNIVLEYCPNCGFAEFDENGNRFYETPSYCKWCGQKIDEVAGLDG